MKLFSVTQKMLVGLDEGRCVAQMLKDDNEKVSVFATGEQAAMLRTNQHAPGLQC